MALHKLHTDINCDELLFWGKVTGKYHIAICNFLLQASRTTTMLQFPSLIRTVSSSQWRSSTGHSATTSSSRRCQICMINTRSILTEIRVTSLESHRESSSNQLREKRERLSHQLTTLEMMRMEIRKNLIVMSVNKKKLRFHQKNWLNWIDLSMLSSPSKMTAKSLQLALSKWPPNIKWEETKPSRVLMPSKPYPSIITFISETCRLRARRTLLMSQVHLSTPSSLNRSLRTSQEDAGTSSTTSQSKLLWADPWCGQDSTSITSMLRANLGQFT